MKKSIVKNSFMMIKVIAAVLLIGFLTNHTRGDPNIGPAGFEMPPPKYFSIGELVENPRGDGTWSLTLMRQGATASYGAYTVTYTEEGYDPANSTIEGFPGLNPMAGPELPATPKQHKITLQAIAAKDKTIYYEELTYTAAGKVNDQLLNTIKLANQTEAKLANAIKYLQKLEDQLVIIQNATKQKQVDKAVTNAISFEGTVQTQAIGADTTAGKTLSSANTVETRVGTVETRIGQAQGQSDKTATLAKQTPEPEATAAVAQSVAAVQRAQAVLPGAQAAIPQAMQEVERADNAAAQADLVAQQAEVVLAQVLEAAANWGI